jgi:DNA-binding transcriptional LysR family regulator
VELRELRVLIAVAEHGTVVRAAKALHQSPSTVSHALGMLEAKVGVRLFNRLGRGMVLTEAGRAMLGPARRSVRESEAARAAATAVEGCLAGRVTVVSGRMMTEWLADLVAAFHALHPSVFVSVLHPMREELIPDMIREGVSDLGVIRSDLVPGDLAGRPVTEQTGAVIVPADHPLASRDQVQLVDLDGVSFVSPSARLDLAFEGMFRGVAVRPHVVAEVDDSEAIFELVRAGMGVAIVPQENVGAVVGRGVVVLPIDPALRSPISLVSRRADVDAAAEALVELAVDRFADN